MYIRLDKVPHCNYLIKYISLSLQSSCLYKSKGIQMYELTIQLFQLTKQWLFFSLSLRKQQWKLSHLTKPALGNSQWEVVLSSLGHQLGSNLASYSWLHIHCSTPAIGFVWQVSCKAVQELPAGPDLAHIEVNKIRCAKKLRTNEEKCKQQNCKAISLWVTVWRSRKWVCTKKCF